MLNTLKLVRGAVAEKELIPVLTHFHIYDGRIQGGNGRITIDAPVPELKGIDATVPADKFLKAVDACRKEPKIKMTDVNMILTEGKFRVQLPLADHKAFPIVKAPTDNGTKLKAKLLPVLKRLRPFIGNDASRAWLCSVLFKDGYAYATTNPVIARVPWKGPDMVLPVYAIDELLRINQEPEVVAVTDNTLTFSLGVAWLQTRLIDSPWPDVSSFFKDIDIDPVPDGLVETIRRIKPFCPDGQFPEIVLSKDGVSTASGSMSATMGGVELPDGRWHADNLLLVLTEATHINLKSWPDGCRWSGDNIDGVAIGLRL